MMTNPRVFQRVKVLLAVLQLPTMIAKRKKEIPSAVVEDFWLAEIIMMRIKILCTVMSALSLTKRIPSIKTKNAEIISIQLW